MIKGNVLLVDDDKDIVESMEIHLKNEGLKVYKAYDGIEALEILLEKEIHLILMDIMMPRMDGLSATLKIREEKKYTQQQLADKLYVSRQTVCRWENGSRCPDLITAKKLAMELGVTLDELISDEDITDIQSKYGIWKFDRVKEREKIQMMQKRILDFIEIIGGIFLAISLLLRVQFDMKVPAWITIICILIVTLAFLFNFVLAKKLDRK